MLNGISKVNGQRIDQRIDQRRNQGKNQEKEGLCEKLYKYGHSDYYGFHMPGHKRNDHFMKNSLPYRMDITEIDGFDDLHHAKEILKEAQERAARVYRAEETCFLINGSTSGLLSAILGCTCREEHILIARNCHKSVYAAVEMNELKASYIYPVYDKTTGLNGIIDPLELEHLLKQDIVDYGKTTVKAVVITSPTYDGVVSDVKAIAEVVHRFKIPLIVDEAHGAHFGFDPYFPDNSNQCGADLVIHSLHKTLPSLTQTALIHMNGTLINRVKVRKYVHMLQTSSPSYILMASMDECIRFLEQSEEAFSKYHMQLEDLRNALSNRSSIGKENETVGGENGYNGKQRLYCLQLMETENYDPSKIVISTRNSSYNGKCLYQELLEKYHLQMEMASQEYILAMTSVCDTEKGFERFKEALFEIDAKLQREQSRDQEENRRDLGQTESSQKEECQAWNMELPRLEQYCTSAHAAELSEHFAGKAENTEGICSVSFQESVGKVSLEYAYAYPPGIPILVPGEIISKEVVHLLKAYENMGFDIEGLKKDKHIFICER